MKRFSTFDEKLVEFLKNKKGIIHVSTYVGRNQDTGYEYDFIPNLKGLLNEYRNCTNQLSEQEREKANNDKFETMIADFLSISKDKNREAERDHTKNESIKKKKKNAKIRKDILNKKNRITI